jgi:aspartyl-tRNA synthetase
MSIEERRFPGHSCGLLREEDVGTNVVVYGWLARRRDHGGLIFLDLRDASGVVQVVAEPGGDAFEEADRARHEWILRVEGTVARRPEGTENPDLPTGAVEIRATALAVLAEAQTPPFIPEDRVTVDEATRLKYRYIDLRRPKMQQNLRLRARVVAAMRRAMEDHGFVEVETPVLTRATPEGARDFLVPSRIEKGKFYALAQSPQLYKQLLMVSGISRYYQIVRCYRDEDPRADRQHEFTQLDLEMSFAEEDDVFDVVESAVCAAAEVAGWPVPELPLPRISWHDAMARFGTDKPDLRISEEIKDLSAAFAQTKFATFAGVLAAGGSILGLRLAGMGSQAARSYLDGLVERAKQLGAKGLVWVVVASDGIRSPVSKYWSESESRAVVELAGASEGDLLILVAGDVQISRRVLGRMRTELAEPKPDSKGSWCWVTSFPLFEWNETEQRLDSLHHPFCAPHPEDIGLVEAGREAILERGPEGVRARAFDLIVDGWEIGSGSVRINDRSVQSKIFSLLGISPQDAEDRFGYLLRAFDFGAPPHAGFAIGLDRLIAVLSGEESIREVIAFPKTQTGHEPMLQTPAPVSRDQLDELGIAIKPQVRR